MLLVIALIISSVVVASKRNESLQLAEDTSNDVDYKDANISDHIPIEQLYARFERLYPVESWKAAGYFTRDYLAIVNRHWLKFDPQPARLHYILAVTYFIIMIIGTSANSLVIYLFARCKGLRTPANILVVNLAFSDLLMMCKMPIFIYNSYYQGPALGDTICRLYGFVGGLSGTCSICTIAAISWDRYCVVKYPLKNRFSSHRAKFCVVFCWLYAGIFSIIPLLDIGYGRYVPEGFLTSCSFDYLTDEDSAKSFILAFSIAAFVIPIIQIIFFYYCIHKIVTTNSQQRLAGRESQRHMNVEDKRKQEVRVTVVVLIVIVLWIVTWTPYAFVALMGISGYHEWITPMGSMIPALFCKTAACCDPIIYALTHPKFKDELNKLCIGKERRREIARRTFTARSNYTSQAVTTADTITNIPEDTSAPIETGRSRIWWHMLHFSLRRSKPNQNNQDNAEVEEIGMTNM